MSTFGARGGAAVATVASVHNHNGAYTRAAGGRGEHEKEVVDADAERAAETLRSFDEDLDGRCSHSSASQLNLSALYKIGGARRGCVARVQGVIGGV
jgi:hypothetical protein